jgi:hypothetical protein
MEIEIDSETRRMSVGSSNSEHRRNIKVKKSKLYYLFGLELEGIAKIKEYLNSVKL